MVRRALRTLEVLWWRSVPHEPRVMHPGSTRCDRCEYHYSHLHRRYM